MPAVLSLPYLRLMLPRLALPERGDGFMRKSLVSLVAFTVE
jgi:hypothetical protein